jgi:hypothetical protein
MPTPAAVRLSLLAALATSLAALVLSTGERASAAGGGPPRRDPDAEDNAAVLVRKGQDVFRHDTLGSEAFWGDTLRIHETIEGEALGGVGPGVSPATALAVGLKVDEDALPPNLRSDLRHGRVDLGDPAVTVALLNLDAVVGVRGFFENGSLRSVGINCALCHSTVDDAFAPGIGKRRDGWPNRDLDVGQVISLAQNLTPFTKLLGVDEATVRAVLASWGPGRFDAHLILDGKAFRPDGKSASVLIPAALGLGGVNLATYTGWGSVPHWNGFVGNLEMHGKGRFFDPRLDDAAKFPIAAAAGFGDVTSADDRITPILEALQLYELAIPVPKPPPESFDAAAAARGRELFAGQANCARCHVPPLFTEPGYNAHTADEIGIDDFQAMRSPTERYRTTPLRGLFTRTKGGFYHDGRFPDLRAVVDHYDGTFGLGLGESQKSDLVEYLNSL